MKLLLTYAICIAMLTQHYNLTAQLVWHSVDSVNVTLPVGLKLYATNDSMYDGKPNIAYYIEADLNNKNLVFDVDTTLNRRLTPNQYYTKNNKPLVVVNGTFFSYATNQNLNVVIKKGKVVGHNITKVQRKMPDSSIVNIPINRSAIGITKRGKADIGWVKTDSNTTFAKASQAYEFAAEGEPFVPPNVYKKWKVQTAIGGGPVLLQNGKIAIANGYEQMFTGKAINDKHPRTAMGYTATGKLIILVIQGRFANIAEGASLPQEAKIMQQLGCVEALNLDGGGSSCMLVNGKETITPSEKNGQRAVPAVFLIKTK